MKKIQDFLIEKEELPDALILFLHPGYALLREKR